MYIWPDGSVTGSVNLAVLDAYNKAKDEGGDLSVFAPFLGVIPEAEPEAAEEPVASAPAEEIPAEEPNAYDGWSLAELQDEAKSRGLASYGTKAEIAERLSQSDTDEEL